MQVGCVVYNAFTPEVHQSMIDSHAQVMQQNKGVIRGHSFEQFAYGKMVPKGARMPQGGETGDDYGPYAHMKATWGCRAVKRHVRFLR